MLKKSFLSLILICLIFLNGCSKQTSVVVRQANVDDIAALVRDFAVTNGFNLAVKDNDRHIYRIVTYNYGLEDAGFGIKLKQVNNDVHLYASSYGFGLEGYVFNKSGKFIKSLKKWEGYKIQHLHKTTNSI